MRRGQILSSISVLHPCLSLGGAYVRVVYLCEEDRVVSTRSLEGSNIKQIAGREGWPTFVANFKLVNVSLR